VLILPTAYEAKVSAFMEFWSLRSSVETGHSWHLLSQIPYGKLHSVGVVVHRVVIGLPSMLIKRLPDHPDCVLTCTTRH
jgi:hypothetical protein